MPNVSIRDLRNHGGEVIERAFRGEQVTITRDGRPVAELRPLSARALSVGVLVARRRNLPALDPEGLRADIDDIIDTRL